MKKISAYGYRDPANALLPRDVLDALARPPHVKHGSLVVFAETSTDAWRRLGELDMAPSSARHLAPITGPRIRALIEAGLNRPDAVYAMPTIGGDLVEITAPPDGGIRTVTWIGRIDAGRFLSNADLAEPEVTSDMVTAALRVAADHEGFALVLHRGVFHEIIAAALKARTES